MRGFQKTRFLIAACIICSLSSFSFSAAEEAASIRSIKVKSGKKASINLTAADKGLKKIIFYAPSKGNSTGRFEFLVESNAPVTAKAYSLVTRSKDVTATGLQSSGWSTLSFQHNGKTRRSVSLFSTAGAGVVSPRKSGSDKPDPNCGCMTESSIEQMLAYGMGMTRQQLCGMLGKMPRCPDVSEDNGSSQENPEDNDGIGDDSTGSGSRGSIQWAEGAGIIQKNTCSKKYSYFAKIEADLSKVPESAFDEGIAVGISLTFKNFDGTQAATMKPASDGKWAPRPILLISQINHGFPEQVRLVYWKGAKIRNQKTLTVGEPKFISSMGRYYYMHLRVMSGFLSGGQAPIEVVAPSGALAYSHCFTLRATRQNRGGYTRPGD